MGLASPCPGGWERKPGHTRAINSGENGHSESRIHYPEMDKPLS